MEDNQKIRLVREALELKQKELALKLGIKPGHYSAIEGGKRSVTQGIVSYLIDKLAVSPLWWHRQEGEIFAISPKKFAKSSQNGNLETDPSYVELLSEISDKLDEVSKDLLYNVHLYLLDIQKYIKAYKAKTNNKSFNEAEYEKSKAKILEMYGDLAVLNVKPNIAANLLLRLKHIKGLETTTKLLLKGILEESRELYLSVIEQNNS